MMKQIFRSKVYLYILILAACGCANQPSQQCSIRDWYEEGRQHGLDGSGTQKEDLVNQIGQQCLASFHKQNQDLYLNGRNAGLIVYCSPQNGFLLGKNEKNYTNGCPNYLEENFLTSFNKGKKLSSMERTNILIEKEMSALSIQLTRSPASVKEKETLVKRLEQLKRTQKITVNEIKRLKSTSQTF